MNENALLMMFEEIKKSLQEIIKKQNEQPVPNEDDKPSCSMKYYYPEITSSVEGIVLNAIQSITYINGEKTEAVARQERKRLEDFFASKSSKLKYHNRHEIVLDIKSSKIFITLVSLSVGLFLAMCISTHLYLEHRKYLDNDLKYRYIKSVKGISKQQLGELENIFEYNRNDSIISKLKDDVIRYETALDRKAQNLEQHELME